MESGGEDEDEAEDDDEEGLLSIDELLAPANGKGKQKCGAASGAAGKTKQRPQKPGKKQETTEETMAKVKGVRLPLRANYVVKTLNKAKLSKAALVRACKAMDIKHTIPLGGDLSILLVRLQEPEDPAHKAPPPQKRRTKVDGDFSTYPDQELKRMLKSMGVKPGTVGVKGISREAWLEWLSDKSSIPPKYWAKSTNHSKENEGGSDSGTLPDPPGQHEPTKAWKFGSPKSKEEEREEERHRAQVKLAQAERGARKDAHLNTARYAEAMGSSSTILTIEMTTLKTRKGSTMLSPQSHSRLSSSTQGDLTSVTISGLSQGQMFNEPALMGALGNMLKAFQETGGLNDPKNQGNEAFGTSESRSTWAYSHEGKTFEVAALHSAEAVAHHFERKPLANATPNANAPASGSQF